MKELGAFTFRCPIDNKELEALNREEAFDAAKCMECGMIKQRRCKGIEFKNPEDCDEAVRQGLRLLKKSSSTKISERTYNFVANLFYDEINTAREAGHSWPDIIQVFIKNGYPYRYSPTDGLASAFLTLKKKRQKEQEAVK